MSQKFQAPRGTHDVLPSDATWWHVVHTIEDLTRRYGYGRIQTPGFEDTALFARTAGEASDVVHKEMYTFTDRSDRSLTLRPEGTAPDRPRLHPARAAQGAAAGQGVHDRADVPLRRPRPRSLPRALAALRRGDRLGRPGRRRRGDPALPRAAAAAGRDEVRADAELDRRCRLPSGLRRAADGLARRAPGRARRGGAPQARDEPAAGVRRQEPARARGARRRAEDRRLALRRVPQRTSTTSGATSTATGFRTRSSPRSSAVSTTTREPPGSSSAPTRTPTRRSPAAAATTGWSRPSAARRHPASASGRASSGCGLALENEGRLASPAGLDVFFVLDGCIARARAPAPRRGAERGPERRHDYAGRSLKGQLTQAGRTGARAVVIVRGADAAVRVAGSERVVALDDLVATLTAG